MGTQAVLNIVDLKTGVKRYKIITGINGHNVFECAKHISGNDYLLESPSLLYDYCVVHMGSEESLVVMYTDPSGFVKQYSKLDSDIAASINKRYCVWFDIPKNPRWELGTADFILTLHI